MKHEIEFDKDGGMVSPKILGYAIRNQRLRAGITQAQLAKAISRSGKFISEVESGKARIADCDLDRLAAVLGVVSDVLRNPGPDESPVPENLTPRRVREPQYSGLCILSFPQLIGILERAGWLRGSKVWLISQEPFPEEQDVALAEQLGDLMVNKEIQLRYVFPASRLGVEQMRRLAAVQGTLEALPDGVRQAIQWTVVRRFRDSDVCKSVKGYALPNSFPYFTAFTTLLWVETADASWSDVMPLAYGRGETRTFEHADAKAPFWYHLPRDSGSKLLLALGRALKEISNGSWSGARPATA